MSSQDSTLRVPKTDITGVILAGGRARRMGGRDKGLIELNGQPMVKHTVASLRPQVGRLLINANRNLKDYAQVGGCEVLADTVGDFAGPLAGMAASLKVCASELLVTVPCDSPLVASDLVERLYLALMESNAEISVAHDGLRLQPVFALLRRKLLANLLEYLGSGERKIDRWYEGHRLALCDLSDRPETFLNINTPEEREQLEQRLAGDAPC